MTTSRKNQSALRAALQKEDAAVAERLPAVAEASAAAQPAASAAKPAAAKPAAAKPAAAKPAAAKPAAAKPAAARNGAADILPPIPNTPPMPAPVVIQAERAQSGKREKAVRDSFSMPKGEHGRIKALRVKLSGCGRPASRSDLLRVGLRLLEQCTERELIALLDALPAVDKGRRKKK